MDLGWGRADQLNSTVMPDLFRHPMRNNGYFSVVEGWTPAQGRGDEELNESERSDSLLGFICHSPAAPDGTRYQFNRERREMR